MNNPLFILLRFVFSFWVKYLIKKYKRLLIENSHCQKPEYMLQLKAKIFYWKLAFDWWGWLMNGRFWYSGNEGERHESMMKKIGFRDNTKEWDIIRHYWPEPVLNNRV